MEKCINKKCVNYDKDDHNNCMTELNIKICPNHLIEKTEPVAQSPAAMTGWAAFREKVRKWYIKYFVAYAFILGWYVGAVCMLIYFAYTTKLGAECFH